MQTQVLKWSVVLLDNLLENVLHLVRLEDFHQVAEALVLNHASNKLYALRTVQYRFSVILERFLKIV